MKPSLSRPLVAAALLGAALFSMPACSSSAPSGDRVTIALPVPHEETSVLGGAMRLSLTAERVCADAACSGRGYYLGVVNAMGREMYIQYAPVRLDVGGRTFTWLEDARDETTSHPAVGMFVRVPLTEEVMQLLALAPNATLWLGSTRFNLTRQHLGRVTSLLPQG